MRQGGLVLAAGRVRSKNKKKRKHKENEKEKKKKTRRKKKKKNLAPPKTHHETHISPATATTSQQRTTKRVPRVSPYSPASIDAGFVEIGLLQLSKSIKTTHVTHTDRLMK